MRDLNCWICNEGKGRGLCDEHRTVALDTFAHSSPGTPLTETLVGDSELVDLCRAICLAPLGVY